MAGTTPVLSVRSSIILLCRFTLSMRVLHDLLVIFSASSQDIYLVVSKEEKKKKEVLLAKINLNIVLWVNMHWS